MFESLFRTASSLARVVTAPVEIAADIANAVIKPVADLAQEAVDAVKQDTKEL